MLFASGVAAAAPEDRGRRGWWLGGGAGVSVGKAFSDDHRDAGSVLGAGGRVRFGEEAVPGLSLGLAFAFVGAADQADLFDAKLGAALLDVNWRPLPDTLGPLVVEGAVGFGVGVLSPKADADETYEGTTAGAAWAVGLAYELGEASETRDAGWVWSPAVTVYWLPAQNDEPTRLVTALVGLEGVWYAGR